MNAETAKELSKQFNETDQDLKYILEKIESAAKSGQEEFRTTTALCEKTVNSIKERGFDIKLIRPKIIEVKRSYKKQAFWGEKTIYYISRETETPEENWAGGSPFWIISWK